MFIFNVIVFLILCALKNPKHTGDNANVPNVNMLQCGCIMFSMNVSARAEMSSFLIFFLGLLQS